MATVGAQKLGVAGWREDPRLADTWAQLNGSCREAYRLDLALQPRLPTPLKAYPQEQLALTHLVEVQPKPVSCQAAHPSSACCCC